MEQLLLVTSCDSPAGIGASLWTDERTPDTGWTHRRDVGNSISDDSRLWRKLRLAAKNGAYGCSTKLVAIFATICRISGYKISKLNDTFQLGVH